MKVVKLTLQHDARLNSGSLKPCKSERQVTKIQEDLFNTSNSEQVSEQNDQLIRMRTGFKTQNKTLTNIKPRLDDIILIRDIISIHQK